MIRYELMEHDTKRYNTIRFDTKRYDATILHTMIWNDMLRSYSIRYNTVCYHGTKMRFDMMRNDTIRHKRLDMIKYNMSQDDTMWNKIIWYNTTRNDTICQCTINCVLMQDPSLTVQNKIHLFCLNWYFLHESWSRCFFWSFTSRWLLVLFLLSLCTLCHFLLFSDALIKHASHVQTGLALH